MNYTTWHEVRDETKLGELVASMQADGWVGSPLVADGDQLLTGAHRYVAAQEAGIEAEVIDIREIAPDWDALIEETGMSYDVAVEQVCIHELAADIKAEYGIDIH